MEKGYEDKFVLEVLHKKMIITVTIFEEVKDAKGRTTYKHEKLHVKVYIREWNRFATKINDLDGKNLTLKNCVKEN